jgi:transcriptional regulator with XRE-family HTH domain
MKGAVVGQVPWDGKMTPEQAATVWRYDLVKIARKRAGLRQRDVAEALGLQAIAGVTNWERGWRLPSLPHFKRLCEVLRVDPRELLRMERKAALSMEVEVWHRLVGRDEDGQVVQEKWVAQPSESS